jgi:long-chain alkane monooxygenase
VITSRRRAAKLGRNPDDIKILYLVYPFLGETREDAKEQHRRLVNDSSYIEAAVAGIGQITDIDFSKYDLDKPLPN